MHLLWGNSSQLDNGLNILPVISLMLIYFVYKNQIGFGGGGFAAAGVFLCATCRLSNPQ